MNTPITTASSALPAGTRLGEFEITGVVGEGGFGIVYAARDTTLDRIVAIKEYLPAAFASRTERGTIEVRSAEQEKTFKAGLSSFINEARMLAKFSHPGLVEVFRFWEGNGTAYMAMRYYRGITLRETIRSTPEVITEEWLCQTLDPILLALRELHAEHCYHRDIAPDNIMVLPNGRSVLMDFGAARRIIGGMTRALTTVLKPGYAPIEQYSDDGSMAQGAWTDVYALGGVLYHAMTGKVPVQAISRMMTDPLKDVATVARAPFSENLCRVVTKCLAVMPEHRYQSIDELRAALGWVTTPVSSTVVIPSGRPATSVDTSPTARATSVTAPNPSGDATPPVSPATANDPLADLLAGTPTAPLPPPPSRETSMGAQRLSTPLRKSADRAPPTGGPTSVSGASAPGTAKSSSPAAILIVVSVLVVALAAGGYFLLSGGKRAAPPPAADAPKAVEAPAAPPAVAASAPALPPAAEPPKQGGESSAASPPGPTAASSMPAPTPNVAAPAASAPVQSSVPADSRDAASASPPTAETGRLRLVVTNGWANVIVNGEQRGTVPPLSTLTLPPGRHTIELRNPSAPPVTRTVEIQPGKSVTLRHSF